MMNYLCNAFNDPSDPWYYVIGVLFLLLVFGAVAVYVIWNGKRNKGGESSEQEQKKDAVEQPAEQESVEKQELETEKSEDSAQDKN